MIQCEATDAILISRVASLETRLMEVEKRLSMPPARLARDYHFNRNPI
jgi:hypothetical protein